MQLDRRTIRNAAGLVVLVAAVAPFVVFAAPQAVGASHSYVVLSSSMAPTMDAGDVVIVDDVSPQQIERDDVITFEQSADGKAGTDRVTHRVVEVVDRESGLYFRTKGDANDEPDQTLVGAEDVVGRVTSHIPYVGHVILFANTGAGLVVLLLVPTTLLVLNEVWALWQGARSPGDPSGTERSNESEPTTESGD